jgi:hypothetical protein
MMLKRFYIFFTAVMNCYIELAMDIYIPSLLPAFAMTSEVFSVLFPFLLGTR